MGTQRSDSYKLAEFLANLQYEQLPDEVIQYAQSSILNAIGCGLGSIDASPSQKARATFLSGVLAQAGSGSELASLIGRPERVDVQTAALLNGITITTADYDDTHLKTVIHPSGTAVAALLPWAEATNASGRELILAFVVAVEAQCAVGNAISPSHYASGWHITGTTGTFGATAGIAKLLHLAPNQFVHALAHAASMAAGIFAASGTDTKTLHMGRAAQNGIIAANLAANGFSGSAAPIEAWAKLVSNTVDNTQISSLVRGGKWQILENTFKPYPCGIVIHPLIDGCLKMHAKMQEDNANIDWIDMIENIEVTVNPQCVRLCSIRHPRSGLETIFSLYHACAVALLLGRAGPKEFSDNIATNDSAIWKLRDKIIAKTDSAIRDDEARICFHFTDDTQRTPTIIHVDHATGSLAKPMTRSQLETKFKDQARSSFSTERIDDIIHACWNLESFPDVSQFVSLLRTSTK